MDEYSNYQIFDRTLKSSLKISKRLAIKFINGVYNTEYDEISTDVKYLNTEYLDENNHKKSADVVLLLNNTDKFHLEFQIRNDKTMVLRMFEYGLRQAYEDKEVNDNEIEFNIAEPKVIFLEDNCNTPDEMQIKFNFGRQGKFDFKINAFKSLQSSPDELAEMGLYILLPFQLLKFRNLSEEDISPDERSALFSDFKKTVENITEIFHNKGISNELDMKEITDLRGSYFELQKYLFKGNEDIVKEGESIMSWDEVVTYTDELRAEGREEGYEEGRAEGREEGLAEGRAEGRAEGLAQGLAQGGEKSKYDIAVNMVNNHNFAIVAACKMCKVEPDKFKEYVKENNIELSVKQEYKKYR